MFHYEQQWYEKNEECLEEKERNSKCKEVEVMLSTDKINIYCIKL